MNRAPKERVTSADGDAVRALIASSAEQLELHLSDRQIDQLVEYVSLLVKWNATYNLTSVRDPIEMVHQHIADSLSVVAPLRRELSRQPGRQLLDVGSGGGLPGLVICVAMPDVDVTCIDSVGKKTAFIGQAIGHLKLTNARVFQTRVEAMTSRFDVVVSRAFAALPLFVQATERLLTPGGVWLAMKGQLPQSELDELESSKDVFHVERVAVPFLPGVRHLIWLRPITSERMLTPKARLQ